MSRTVHLFTRDLRLMDHPALEATEGEIIGLFVFTSAQVSQQNKLRSERAMGFMMASLEELNDALRRRGGGLWVEYGEETHVLEKLVRDRDVGQITITQDWTPYARDRLKRIEQWAEKKDIQVTEYRDLLTEEDPLTSSGNYYQVFTSYYKRLKGVTVPEPSRARRGDWLPPPAPFDRGVDSIRNQLIQAGSYTERELPLRGGREAALRILRSFNPEDYDATDCLDQPTSMLSAHHHFGTISVRESYHSIDSDSWREGLYWREFHYYVSRYWPGYYSYQHLFQEPKGDPRELWSEDARSRLSAWKHGRTGVPIVDAIQRQLQEEGWIGNRERLITGEFLVKILRVPWKQGERYFTRMLVDIDRAQNTGNWNWVSSFGLDRARFLRIFNPWTQGERYDPDAQYIKRWIPELEPVPAKELHKWYQYHSDWQSSYPAPIIQYSDERDAFKKAWLELYG